MTGATRRPIFRFAIAVVVLLQVLFFLWTPARLSDDDLFQGDGIPAGTIRFANRLNQTQPWQWIYTIAVLATVYVGRTCIIANADDSKTAWSWYWILAVATLPIIWLLIAPDWYNEHAHALAYWVGTPMQLLVVPTIGMFVLNLEPPLRTTGTIILVHMRIIDLAAGLGIGCVSAYGVFRWLLLDLIRVHENSRCSAYAESHGWLKPNREKARERASSVPPPPNHPASVAGQRRAFK